MSLVKEGQTINGKYQIIEKIGEGATSYVYLAYDLVFERNVSLKVLKEDNLTEKKIRNFQKEAHAISLLNHPNIIKIYEISNYKHTYYIAQEYIDGMSLKEYIENTDHIPTKKAVDVIIKVLEGLAHAHSKRVIHKDIKSQNILLGVNQEIKITDFGIADILEDDMTKTQSLMGTPQYVAPEVLNKGYSTHQTDIYSTGILLYELLIGHAPFYGEKPTIIILKQLNQPIPSVKQQRDEIPQSLENVLIKSTAKKLSNRYQTAEEMIEDLQICFNLSKVNEPPLIIKNDFEFQDIGSVNLSKIKEEEELNQKKLDKKKTRRNYVLVLSVVFIFLFLVIFINLMTFYNTQTQLMPDLKGDDAETAKATLLTYKIEEEDIKMERQENKEVGENLIIETVPAAGEPLTGEGITLIVSAGITPIKLDDYVGEYKEDAENELKTLGLEVEFFYTKSEEEKGKVITQSPDPDTEVYTGDTITLLISNGLESVEVPNLTKMTEEEFDKWVEKNNLNYSKNYECNDTEEEGTIMDQEPKEGEKVKEGNSVTITVSKGVCEEPTDENDSANDEEDTADNKNNNSENNDTSDTTQDDNTSDSNSDVGTI